MFDPTATPTEPLPAASVILVRERGVSPELEVFLVRRHRRSSFMSDAFVFPGGRIETDDVSAERAAIRELFEEAGVLLSRIPIAAERLAEARRRLLAEEIGFGPLLVELGTGLAKDSLHEWARWITPSVEPKRFDATFFVARLPDGQVPSFDSKETVDELWITPAEAIARHTAGTLRLPPPQLRIFHELVPASGSGFKDLVDTATARRAHQRPILPRFHQDGDLTALLLPWDPDYGRGLGEAQPFPPGHPLGSGPSRFVLEGMGWRLTYAAGCDT